MNKFLIHSYVLFSTRVFCLCFFVLPLTLWSQDSTTSLRNFDTTYRVVVAGQQYKAGSFHKKMLGTHYRAEWTTPVKVKTVLLDTLYGGLTPVRSGGRQQTSTLHLEDKNGKPYVLRSIDKSYEGALPNILRGTFIEKWANDQVSTIHPYAALTIPLLAEAAGIYHTYPQIVFVPKQTALDSFNEQYGDNLFLLEERPDGDQSSTPRFGYSPNVVSTTNLFNLVSASNLNIVDQKSFVRARLFDVIIGDWGRHEDQWRWASFEQEGVIVYKPIPRDRDQVYTLFDGLLVSLATSADPLEHLQSFKPKVQDIEEYNAQARHLDRRFTNELVWEDWEAIAQALQQALTDTVIAQAIRQLPSEVFSHSGPTIIANLKSRRNQLRSLAYEYYTFLAKDVDIAGSMGRERFEIRPYDTTKVKLSIYRIDSLGAVASNPYYTRVFLPRQTKEIRVYGLGGEDQYLVDRHINDDFLVRLIGGVGVDSFAKVSGTEKESGDIVVYDSKEAKVYIPKGLKKRLSDKIYNHYYDYRAFAYDAKGTVKSIFYNRRDRLYLRFGYQIQRQHWRKYPFGFDHKIYANYSISQGAPSFGYEGNITQFPGKWNLLLNANYDAVVDVHFFGVGNNTVRTNPDNQYYRLRRRDLIASVGLGRQFLFYHQFVFNTYYNFVDLLVDENRYISDHLSSFKPNSFERKHYAGLHAEYVFEKWDNMVLPTRGAGFMASLNYAHNLKESSTYTAQYSTAFGVCIPLISQVSLAIKAGAATTHGDPEFFQLSEIGGSRTLRGYVRERFYGKSSFFNGNELQWSRDFRSFIMNGKLGLLAHYDLGRVWQPSQSSTTWHRGYGAGVMLAPFNKITFTATYSISKEDKMIHLRVGKFFEGQIKRRYTHGAP